MISVYGPTFLKFLGEGWGQITFPNSTNRDNVVLLLDLGPGGPWVKRLLLISNEDDIWSEYVHIFTSSDPVRSVLPKKTKNLFLNSKYFHKVSKVSMLM